MGIIARQSIKASLVGFVGVGIGAFSRLFLYTKFLTPSEIGILETIMKLGMLMTPFFIFGAPQVIIRYFHRFENNKNDGGLIYTYAFLSGVILIPFSSIVYFLSKDFIYGLYTNAPELSKYYLLPILVAVFYGLFNFLRSISIVNLRITIPVFLNGVLDRTLILILLCAYGLFSFINIDQFLYLNIIFFFIVPFVIMFIYVFTVLKPKIKRTNFSESIEVLKTTIKYNAYLLFGSISEIIIMAIDINMIAGNLGTSQAGIYTIAYFMGTVIDIPRRSLINIIYPILNKAIINNDKLKLKELYQKSSVNQFLVGGFMFLIIWLNIDSIFLIIPNGENFMIGKLVVLFIGLSKLFDMLMGVNKQIIELSKYYKFNLFNNISLSILIIILNLIFINLDSPTFGGINGVAFASLLALVLSNLFSYIVVLYFEKIQPLNVNHLKILLLMAIVFALSLLISISNPFISIVIKTSLISSVFVVLTLLFNISDDFKNLFTSFINKLKQ